ncbi:MAG: FAD-binding protein [Candidatus Thermoplasmatota archaeon]|nr:FAD-binding protein [Candidatus Thermoplasmatota archaeon]
MHVVGAGVDRAIDADTPPSHPTSFSAKDEVSNNTLYQGLQRLTVGSIRIASSPGELMLYARDQSEIPRFLRELMFSSVPEAVVQAETPEVVLEVLRFASSTGLNVIPRGSGSSPFGGSVPVNGGLVLDLSRMDKIVKIDGDAKTVTVQAGARWFEIDHALEAHGLSLTTSPSSKFSTVGGWVATGGVGINSFSRGHLSGNVVSLELAAPRGEFVRFTPSDPGFMQVFGSEGQLGVVTIVTLKVMEISTHQHPHLLVFDDRASALKFAEELASSEVSPVHIIFESSVRVELTNRLLDKPRVKPGEALIVYIEGEESETAFDDLLKSAGLTGEPEYLARYLWNERFFPMKIRKFGPGMMGLEVILSRKILPAAMLEFERLSSSLELEPLFEVHYLPDGQAMVLGFFMTDQGNTIRYTLDSFKSFLLNKRMIDLGAKPYSLGIWNHAFSGAEDRGRKDELRKLKSSLDPRGIMNQGKYFHLSGRMGRLSGLIMHPSLMGSLLRAMLMLSPITMRLISRASRFSKRYLEPKRTSKSIRIADECAMCGACVGVCPAYMILGDERVTARGKMLTYKAMANGVTLSKEHAHRSFLCMRCKACEQVCQSKLELIPFYDELESQLERVHGKDAEEIERFIRFVESSPQYDELVERGLVIGAPKHNHGGAPHDI